MDRTRLAARLCTALLLLGGALLAPPAQAYRPIQKCGSNDLCRIVDVLDRTLLGETRHSSVKVGDAWNALRAEGCQDVADVVVPGSTGENGVPGSSVPGNWAHHLMTEDGRPDRCTIVVSYELESPFVFDFAAYDDSVEHGRKALAIVMNALQSYRRLEGMRGALRVWGQSKGASVVESTWRMEARNAKSKYITHLAGRARYVDACPDDDCMYFGLAYPWQMEANSRFSISRAAASTWNSRSPGEIRKPSRQNNDWERLTTYTHASDPGYTCVGCFDLAFSPPCHLTGNFLQDQGYEALDRWNRIPSWFRVAPLSIAENCGDPN